MATPVYQRTFGAIKVNVWRLAEGNAIRSGTLTGGSGTTMVDTVNFLDATDTDLKGRYFYVHNGAGQSRSGRTTAFTPSTDTITIPSGTALDNTSEYVLSRQFSHDQVLLAMRNALIGLGRYGKDYIDQSLIGGSPLVNGTFYDNSGTFPNGWTRTGTGTFTRESTVTKHGLYSCSIVSTTTNAAGIRQDLTNIGRYRGRSLVLRGYVFTNTASRVNLTLDDGIDTTTGVVTIGTSNAGWGSSEYQTPALAISDRASRIRASCNITADAGGSVTAYFSGVWIQTGLAISEYQAPAGSPTAIEKVWVERDPPDGSMTRPYPVGSLVPIYESTRRIRTRWPWPEGHIVELKGRTNWADHATLASDDDTTYDGSAEWLQYAAAAELLRGVDNARADEYERKALTYRPNTRPKIGSLFLERQ